MNKVLQQFLPIILFVISFFACTDNVYAATLRANPNTGVYSVGKTFTVSVVLNTEGKAVNAADGQLSFNPRELQVTQISRSSSIFNLWTEEPTYSNTGGTISFGGGSPSGYKGGAGTVLTITFKPLGAGTPKINFTSGSVLAADGLGTNILTGMSGGTYTIAAATDSPAPEYIPPANTPQAPVVESETHPNQNAWYPNTTAKLKWNVPAGVVAIRTLLDTQPGTVPTIVYDTPFSEKVIDTLPQGISYFHIQFKNNEGWGRMTHYKLAVDTEDPESFSITHEITDAQPSPTLIFDIQDISPIIEYKIQIDGKEPFVYKDETASKKYALEPLQPGYHTITVEAFDSAGNSAIASYALTIEAFEKPIFTEYPTRVNVEVIPAIKGTTRPNATVYFELKDGKTNAIIGTSDGSESDAFAVKSNANGEFTFIPNEPFVPGTYILSAVAQDELGRMSERSDEIRFIVDKPGYILIGSFLVNMLSVFIPLVALVLLLIFGTWYLWHRLLFWRKRVRKETKEAEESLKRELAIVMTHLHQNIEGLRESRKGKLTKQETDLFAQIDTDMKHAQSKIAKEIEDIEESIL